MKKWPPCVGRQLDLERRLWTLPGARTKNGRPHVVPLSGDAMAVIEAVPQRAGRELVFGEGHGGFSGWSQSKKRLDARIARQRAEARLGRQLAEGEPLDDADALPSWTIHDLRRTFATLSGEELGIQPHVVEAVLNHVSGHKAGVAGVYNKAVYLREKTEALTLWADRLAAAVAGTDSNIVVLRAKTGTHDQ